MVEVILSAALLCFPVGGVRECHPMLYGVNTIPGTYQLQLRLTESPGYGGDVLQYDENDKVVMAIHRVWLLNPAQNRMDRLTQNNLARRQITAGCVNVAPDVYERLRDCCSQMQLTITK